MTVVSYMLSSAGQRPRWVVDADQLPHALACVHQTGLLDLELRTGDGRPPTHAELTTRYLATDEFCGFHLYEAVISLAGVEVVRTRYAVPKDEVPEPALLAQTRRADTP